MKLKTKLIPLASVAAVCATVAPISLTSCGTDSFKDLTKSFKPSFESLEGEYLTWIQATNVYYDFFSKNPNLFSEEYYWSESMMFFNKYGRGIVMGDDPLHPSRFNANFSATTTKGRPQELKEKISDVSFGTTQHVKGLTYFGFPFEIDVITMSFSIESKYILNRSIAAREVTGVESILEGTTKLTYKNVPFIIYPYTSMIWYGDEDIYVDMWALMPFEHWICNDIYVGYGEAWSFEVEPKEWSISVERDETITRIDSNAQTEEVRANKNNVTFKDDEYMADIIDNNESAYYDFVYDPILVSYYLYNSTAIYPWGE